MKPKRSWVNLSSLLKLENGEVARVPWPRDATDAGYIPYREGWVEFEMIGKPTPRLGTVWFRWNDDPTDRIQIEMPKQIEVLRDKTPSGSTRRLG